MLTVSFRPLLGFSYPEKMHFHFKSFCSPMHACPPAPSWSRRASPGLPAPGVSYSGHLAWGGMTTQRKQLPPNTPFLKLSWAQADPPSRDCSTKKGLRAGAINARILCPHRTRRMMPTSGASLTSHRSSIPRTLSNSRPSGSGNSSSTTGQSQSQKQWGWARGLRVHPRLSLTPSPSGGTVSMATYSDTSSSSKQPWRYTGCPKSLMTSLSRSGRR